MHDLKCHNDIREKSNNPPVRKTRTVAVRFAERRERTVAHVNRIKSPSIPTPYDAPS